MVSPRSIAAFYVLVLALCAVATSCAPSHRETTLRLDDPAAVYPLASHLQLAADPRGVLSPDEAAARALPSSAWRGRLDERVWLRIDLASAVDAEWGLSLAPPHDEATIYQTQGQGWLATQLQPRASSQWIPLALRRGRTVVLIRLARLSTAPPFFQLATREAHARAEQRFVFVQGLYFGVVALTVLLNLVVLRLRERAHSFYVLLVSLTATYFALRTGVASRFLVPALSREASLVPEVLALVFATAAATQFGRVFLGTARHAPRTDRVLRAHVALSLLVALCVPLAANPYAPAVVVGLSFPFAMLGAGLFAWRGGSRWAPLYLLAWGIFFLGALALVQPTILGGAVEPIVVLQLGSGVELLLLALALVLRLRILRGERREAEARAARAERLALLGKVAAGVIHEVNNPNNLVTFNLPLLRTYLRALTPVIEDAARREPSLTVLGMAPEAFFEDVASILQQMQHGSERITKITGELRSYINIGRGSPVWEDGDVNVAVERAIALVKRTHQLDNDALDARLAPKLPRLRMVPSHLERVIENLLVNAVQATASTTPRRIVVSTRVKAGAVLLEVCDNGPGMTEEVQARLFEPFFTTRAASEGTGLGLAICEELVREHGGTIRASRDGQWTRLVVELAVAEGVMPDRVDGE